MHLNSNGDEVNWLTYKKGSHSNRLADPRLAIWEEVWELSKRELHLVCLRLV